MPGLPARLPTFPLPRAVQKLHRAQVELASHYARYGLRFTLDGRLLGDIAEAVALEHFDLLAPPKRTKGVDAVERRTGTYVQVKCSARNAGPAFSAGQNHAKHLLFFLLDLENAVATLAYNGPESSVRALLNKQPDRHTVVADLRKVLAAGRAVPKASQLKVLSRRALGSPNLVAHQAVSDAA